MKQSGEIESDPVYFNSITKAIINWDKYKLDKSFQEILYRIDNWINEGSKWVIESIEAKYVSISIYSPFSGSTCIELPRRLKYSVKVQMNIKNKEKKLSLLYIRH